MRNISALIWLASFSWICIDITTTAMVCSIKLWRYFKYWYSFCLQMHSSVCFHPWLAHSHNFRSCYSTAGHPHIEATVGPLCGVLQALIVSSKISLEASQLRFTLLTDCLRSTSTCSFMHCRQWPPSHIHIIQPFLVMCGLFPHWTISSWFKDPRKKMGNLFLSNS